MDQLVETGMIDHELGCIILRRQNQVDRDSNPAIPYLNHRHILECDFSTLALSGTSISDFLEFQNQFAGQTVKHAIEACQLVIILGRMHHHDAEAGGHPPFQKKKKLQSYATDGHYIFGTCLPGLYKCMTQQARHELIASRLDDLYARWPTPKDNLSIVFSLLHGHYNHQNNLMKTKRNIFARGDEASG